MNTILRRISSTAAILAALIVTPLALATPTISFTGGQFPATGSPVALATTPAGLTISVTAAPTAGASIVSVQFSINGSSLGAATGSSPFTMNWAPSVAGAYTISATVTDTSAITTGAGASTNTATINSIVTISAARAAVVAAPINNATLAQNSQIFLRSTAAMSDGVVQQVEFILDPGPGETIIGTALQAPYNVPYLVTAGTGAHTLVARATASDGVTTFNSATTSVNVVSAVGTRPTVTVNSPLAGAYLATSTPVIVTATASDSDGFIPSSTGNGVTFFADGDPIGTDLTAPYSISWTPNVAKVYSLVAQAVDDRGNIGQSTAVSVTAVATLPTVTVTAPTTGVVGTAASLSATATASPGATVSQVQFFANGAAIGAAVVAAPYSVLWTPAQLGANLITAQVTDSAGITAVSSTSTVTVSAPTGTVVTLNSPANAATIVQGSQVYLRTSAAIAGNIVSRVDYYLDGAAIAGGSVSQTPYNVEYTFTAPLGAHTVFARAVASDGTTTVDSATAVISIVAAVGVAPTVAITTPTTGSFVATGSTLVLGATASDADGFISSSTGGGVTFYADGEPVGNDLSAPYVGTWTPATAKTYSLRAQTVDDKGNVVLSTPVTVTAVAALPTVALSSPPSTGVVGTAVTLTATATASPGAAVTQVAFFANGAAIGLPATVSPYTVSWTPSLAGANTLTAQVTDSAGISVVSSVANVTVGALAPTVVVTAPVAGSVVTAGSNVTLTATATPGAGATVAQVQFLVGGTTIVGTDTSAPYSVSWTPPAAGNFSITAKVVDSLGNTATSAVVSVTAVSATSVAVTSPANNATATVGTPTTVTASAAPVAGSTITSVSFLAGGVLIPGSTVATAPYTFAWTPSTAGATTLTAQAVDSNGTTVTSSAINVTVNNSAPTIALTAPLAGSVVTAGSAATLAATALPGSGGATVTQVQFLAGTTVVATLAGNPASSSYTTPWLPATAGNFSLTARVTDSNGNSTTSAATSVTAVAAATPTAIITAPVTGSVVTVGSTVTLSATASPGTGATVAQIQFLSGGTTILGTTTTPVGGVYSIAWVPTTASNFSLTARVLDTAGNTGTSSIVTVTTVLATSVSLTAPANNSTATVGTATSVTASATPTAGATITRVDFFAGATAIGTANSAPYTIAWTPGAAGIIALTAQAVDSNGATVTSSLVSVNVNNSAPTVAITAPLVGSVSTVGAPVTVTATATPGSGGATVTQVQFLAGTTVVATLPGNPASAVYSTTWTPATAANFSLTAKVTDSNGNSTTSVAIVVTANAAAAPTVAITAPLVGSVFTVGSSVTVAVTAMPGSGGAAISQVQFLAGTTVVATLPGNPASAVYNATWIPASAGNFSLTAKVTDSNGNSTTSPVVVVTANATAAPTIAITGPVAGSVVTVGNSVTLSANVSPGTGATIAQVQFLSGTTILGTTTAPVGGVYSVTWTPLTAGNVSLTAKVIDSTGATATSAVVAITASTVSPTVAITSPTNGSVLGIGGLTTLTATASANGALTVARVDFLAGTTIVGTALLTDVNGAYSVNWTPVTAGTFALTARVTDSIGTAVTSAVVNVVVTAPTVVITSPANGSRVSFATPITLTANANAFGSATVVKVDFYVGTTFLDTATPGAAGTYTLDWTPTSTGTQSLTAKVTDSNGAIVTSTVLSVNVATVAPVATLTSPTTGTSLVVGTPVALTATATAGGGATVTRVDFLTNSSTIVGTALVGAAGVYTVNWTPTAASTALNISARVTDSNNAVDTSNFATVSVTSSTTLGVSLAVTGGSATIPVGSSRYLTAGVSGLAAISQVEFYLDGELIGVDTMAPFNTLFVAPAAPGPHTLTAKAIDGNGNVAPSPIVPITITGAIGGMPAVGLLAPVSGSFVAVNTTTTITGIATDSDGSISTVQLFANGVSIGNASLSGSTFTISWFPTTLGSVSLSAVATDNQGNAISAPPLGVYVAESSSPNITLASSPGSSTLPAGATRNIVASALASTGRAVVRVEFFVDGTKVGEDTSVPYTFRYVAPALASGEQSHPYVISARATDNAGAARDAQLTLQVISPVGVAPTVNLLTPANGATTVPGAAVTLAATATSAGGTVVSVQFYVNGNPSAINAGNAVSAAPYVTSYTPTTPGTYTFDAVATDDRGNTAVSNSATITASFSVPTITITSPNPNATARATPNVPLTLSATATVQTGAGASVLLVEFLLDGVQIATRTTATNAALGTYATTWIPTAAQLGAHVLTARVTDTNSQSATSASVNVNVANAVGTPPTITISTSPIPGSGLQTLSQVNFFANAFANGVNTSINSVEFFLNDVSIGLASREQTTNLYRLAYDFSRIDFATAPVNPSNPAQYILPLYAIARDSNNNQTVSTTSNLTINAATSAPPTITLSALTPTTVTQATQVLLLPIFADSDGTIAQIQLFVNGTVVQTIGAPTSNQSLFTYTANTPGRFNLYAVATDDTGNTAIATPAIVVQVNAVNAPDTTLTRPSTNSTATTVNAPVFLEGTARVTGTTSVPTLVFIATGSSGSRTQINGSRVGTTTTYRAIWTPTTADTYSLVTQATVAGVQNTSTASRTVVVNELIGLAPAVSIGVPSTVTTASSANFIATVSDSDGSVIDVEFFVNRNSIGQAVRDQLTNTWRITASFAGLTPGSTEVVARATDSAGNVAASSTSFINLVAASSIAPSITVTPSTTNAAYNRQVQLRANARDNDGTVSSVQYYANGSSLGSTGNSSTSYQVNWTPATSGTFNVYAIATDNTSNLTVSATVQIVVRRNNPILEDAAFILQTYQDIANTTTINPLVFDDLDTRLSSGTLARSDLVVTLMADPAFLPPINLLATYYVLMGQWPTPQNYTTLLSTARNGLANAVSSIIASNEYFAKYGVVPTTALLNSAISVLPAQVFLDRLWANAGASPAVNRQLDLVRFMNNNTVSATIGRGYNSAGLPSAIAEFITNTNSTNTALFKRARAAALFYQLARPPVDITVDAITERVNALVLLTDDKATAEAVLKDTLYAYRYVTITKHPVSLTVSPRSGAIFNVEAIGSPPLAYQWLLNGSPLPGATNDFLSLTNVSSSNAGTYTVAITSSAATATSDPATLALSSTPTRLANISTRGSTTAGANVLIGGFVVAGTANQTRQMLIRVVGPTLGGAPFNVNGSLANPALELYAGTNRNAVLTNDDWGTQAAGAAQVTAIQQAAARAGAFALPLISRDAAVLATLAPGPYTVMAMVPAATPNATGVVLIEVYDVTQGGVAGPKAANVSTRGFVGTGTNSLIAGFVVNGAVSRRMLIRGAGPTLAAFGVPGVLADPQITLVAQATGEILRVNDNWASGEDAAVIAAASVTAGAFPFASTSRDAAMIIMLEPGAYTVQLSGVGNTTGVGIVEVYDVDP